MGRFKVSYTSEQRTCKSRRKNYDSSVGGLEAPKRCRHIARKDEFWKVFLPAVHNLTKEAKKESGEIH